MKKTKILHVYNIMNRGGAETFIMNVFRNIDREKFQFDFLCISPDKGDYDDEIISLGGKIIHYKKFNKRNILSVIRETINIINENDGYDAIHVQFQFYSGIYCLAAALAHIKKRIVHSHSAGDMSNNSFHRKIYCAIMRILISLFSTDKIACGDAAGKFLFGKKSSFRIIYNGIDLSKYSSIDRLELLKIKKMYNINNQILIGHVGRFEPVKNHDFFIKIANELIKRKVDFKIVLVGTGSYFTKYKQKIQKNGLSDYFIFAGLQKNPVPYFQLCNVFVMPSLYEGFPVSIIEALACGKPCILSSNITKEVDIMEKMCTFLSLDNDSVSTWCENIINKSKMRFDIKKCIDLLSKKEFSINSTINSIYDLYLK